MRDQRPIDQDRNASKSVKTGTEGHRDGELRGEGGTHAKEQEWHNLRPKEERN